MINIELKKNVYVEILELLKSLKKMDLVEAMVEGYDPEWKFPIRKPKKEPLSEDEGSAPDEDLSYTIDEEGFWSLK